MISFNRFFVETSPATFELAWHHRLISKHLEKVERGEIRNLGIFTPPQHGKSTTVAERYPAYHLGRDPLSHVLLCSYSDDLAVRAAVNCRQIIQSEWWQEKFPYPVGKATESRMMLNVPGQDGRYSLVASGINSSITGHSARLAVIDDVLRGRMDSLSPKIREGIWQNFTGSVESRLPKDGSVVMITTRWHEDDLPGRILLRAKENPKASQWTVLVLPATNDSGEEAYVMETRTGERNLIPAYAALWPNRYPRAILDQRRADLGESLWHGLYQCRPSMGTDLLFPPEAWGTYDGVETDNLEMVVQSWDTASKTAASNDYTCCVTLGRTNDGRILILDVWKAKVDFAHLPGIVLARWQSCAQMYKTIPLMVIEDANSGTQLIQLFQASQQQVPLLVSKPAGRSKLVRAEGVTPLTRSGCVFLPRIAPWRDAYLSELAAFPLAAHDDTVDATVNGLKAFLSGGDFRPAQFLLPPGQAEHSYERAKQRAIEDMEYERAIGCVLSDGFKDQGLDW
jgi:predicted phage terminase large subunit-like protein